MIKQPQKMMQPMIYSMLSLCFLAYSAPSFASLYEECAASIPKKNLQQLKHQQLNRQQPKAVADAFMQALAHDDMAQAVALVDIAMLEQGEEAGRRYTEGWIAPIIDDSKQIGGIHGYSFVAERASKEVYLPEVVNTEIALMTYTVQLQFCLKNDSKKGYEIKPAKVKFELTLAQWDGQWSVLRMDREKSKSTAQN